MSMLFDGTYGMGLKSTETAIAGIVPPFTAAVWGKHDSDPATDAELVSVCDLSAINLYHVSMSSDEYVRVGSYESGWGLADVAIEGTIDEWIHYAGVWTSTTDRRAIRNGDWAGSVQNTESKTVANVDIVGIGTLYYSDGDQGGNWDGHLAEIAIWDVALVQWEIEALGGAAGVGLSPLLIRPTSLILYAPLQTNRMEMMTGLALDEEDSGPTQNDDHPAIWLPSRQVVVPVAAVPSGVTVAPAAASFTLTGVDPTVLTPVTVAPATASFQLAAVDPTVLTPVVVAPAAASFQLTATDPTVLTPVIVAPAAASFTLAAVDPTVVAPIVVAPAAASFTLTGVDPTVSVPIVVAPAAASFTLSATNPTVPMSTPVVTRYASRFTTAPHTSHFDALASTLFAGDEFGAKYRFFLRDSGGIVLEVHEGDPYYAHCWAIGDEGTYTVELDLQEEGGSGFVTDSVEVVVGTASYTVERWVSPGHGGTDSGTEANPYLTIQQAITDAQGGWSAASAEENAIHIEAGTSQTGITGGLWAGSFTSAGRCVFRKYGTGADPILGFSGATSVFNSIDDCTFAFQDIDVQGGTGRIFYIERDFDNTPEGVEFTFTGGKISGGAISGMLDIILPNWTAAEADSGVYDFFTLNDCEVDASNTTLNFVWCGGPSRYVLWQGVDCIGLGNDPIDPMIARWNNGTDHHIVKNSTWLFDSDSTNNYRIHCRAQDDEVRHVSISNNTVKGRLQGFQIYSEHITGTVHTLQDVWFHHNLIDVQDGGDFYGWLVAYVSGRFVVRNNWCRSAIGMASGLGSLALNEAGSDIYYEHNSFVIEKPATPTPTGGASVFSIKSGQTGITIRNNAVYSNTNGTIELIGTDAGVRDASILDACDGNVLYVPSGTEGWANGGSGFNEDDTTLAAWQADTPYDDNSAIGDPDFDDALGATLDLNLGVSSVCTDAAVAAPGIDTDFRGFVRGGDLDIGAIDPDAMDVPTPAGSGTTVTPAAASFTLSGVDPTVLIGSLSITPAAASFTLTGVDPTVLSPVAVEPAAAAFTLTGVDPTVAIAGGGTTVAPSAASFQLTGADPTVVLGSLSLTPAEASFTLTATDPVVSAGGVTIAPAAASFTLGTTNPVVVLGSLSIAPVASSFTLSTTNPTIALGSVSVTPAPASFTFGATDPTVADGSGLVFAPAAASFTFTATDPFIPKLPAFLGWFQPAYDRALDTWVGESIVYYEQGLTENRRVIDAKVKRLGLQVDSGHARLVMEVHISTHPTAGVARVRAGVDVIDVAPQVGLDLDRMAVAAVLESHPHKHVLAVYS